MERRIAFKLVAVSLTLGLIALPVSAGTDSWSVTGSPSGGWVGKLIVDPSTPTTLYVTSNSGVYKSTDSGATWVVVLPMLDQPEDLVIDPLHPATLYVAFGASETGSLFKTTDGGANWSEADSGISKVEDDSMVDGIQGLSVDPVNEGTVYATTMNTGLYKSSDGGDHWSAIDTGASGLVQSYAFLYPIAIDPVNPQVLYLATQVSGPNGGLFSDEALSGIFKSVDGGAHWTQLVDHMGFNRITIDPSNHTTVYAGGGSVYVTTNSGTNWAPVSGWPVQDVISVDPTDSQHLWGTNFYDGVYETTDGGTNWNRTSLVSGIYSTDVETDPVTPANLYAISSWGVFKSTDSGATWALSNEGLHNVEVDEMIEGDDDIIYLASGYNGIYKSADQGVTWAQVGAASGPTGSLPTGPADTVYALVEDPTANSTLYAATQGGVYKTIDGGDSWTAASSGVPASGQTLALAMDPEVPSTLYAATNTLGAGVYKSIDGGANWTAAGTGLSFDPTEGGFQALAVDPHNSDVVYAGAFFSGLFKSTDGGATWQPDNGAIGVTDIWGIAIDPNDSSIVYTATSNGFFKSTDAGATWVESDWGLGGYWDMTDIQIDPNNTSIIYASQRYGLGDAFVSPDAGYTWYDMSTLQTVGVDAAAKAVQHKVSRSTMSFTGGHTGRSAQSIGGGTTKWAIAGVAMDPRHPSQLLGGANDGQVYSFDVKDLPKGGHPQTTGGGSGNNGGGGSGGTAAGVSGSGGGNFGLLLIFGLAGFVARRRR